ncbi:MAG TPA: multidrug ABC transporter substrate-binding protein [Porphyromonadaceae bacterium]|jgi:ABC-type antimicrobial peptide transport system permease subunit|nr:multidrug ABC transporter substrate-binding protein [Porphyromonadaceae bacterium]
MFKTTLKLIFRNWWRNKTFTLISMLSLTVGIACTALLISFVSYEYGIEKNNPNRDKLVWVMQDMPSNPGVRVGYMEKGVPEQMKEKYPEVEDFLQLNSFYIRYIEVNNRRFDPIGILNVNSSFPNFFPFDLRYGSWSAFNNPQSIIISERQARKLFGDENAIGKQITVSKSNSEMQKTYTVGAVTKTRSQSAIIFDGLICDPENNWGGPTLLMIVPKTDLQQFAEKVKKDQIPTLADGQYYFSTFDQAISSEYNQQGLGYWHYRKKDLLMVGLASAILVFIIAIFNYVNLSFSRVLQQVKTLHAQKLMGAKPRDVRLQIFLDTFLTVFISFVLAMFLMHDLLPVFNQVVSVDFSSKYFYDKDFFPLLIFLILLLTIIPALGMSRKISRMSISDYQMFFVTHKNRWIGALVIFQFIIAIALIIATFTAKQQVNLVKQNGDRYKNLIELISTDHRQDLRKLKPKITDISGVSDVSLGNSALMDAMVMYGNLRKENGEEIQTLILQLSGDEHLLRVLKLHQLEGEAWETMTENQPNSVLINKSFADRLNKSGTELIGEPLQKYLISDDSASIITGIVDDFHFSSLEDKVMAVLIQKSPNNKPLTTMEIRMDGKNNLETIANIRTVWQQTYSEEYFTYTDVYHEFTKSNRKIFEMSRLLNMYSLISILLTCFGLFGITFYAVRQRTKEIGIRKINGAKTPQLLWLLMKPMFVWLAVGFVAAAPLAWWLMERWLQQFVYRVDVSILSFVLALMLVAVITFLTVSWHVWRTAKANPVESLKSE